MPFLSSKEWIAKAFIILPTSKTKSSMSYTPSFYITLKTSGTLFIKMALVPSANEAIARVQFVSLQKNFLKISPEYHGQVFIHS